MAKIIGDNFTFTYSLGSVHALKNLNFEIQDGEFVVLCGKSGCGKSTLLKNLKKQLKPCGMQLGTIKIDGIEVENMDEEESVFAIGYIHQSPENQIITDKVWHEMAFGLENLGMSNDKIKRRVGEMANYFGIESWFDRSTKDLSGGEMQILNLASVMAMQPQVLILDEPTSQLDPIRAREFINIIDKINKEFEITVIMSEHRLEDAVALCDRIMVLDKGELIAFGDIFDVKKQLTGKDGKMHEIFTGFPAVMQIFEDYKGSDQPVSIRDGRRILSERFAEQGGELVESEPVKLKSDKTIEELRELVISLKGGWFKYAKELPYILRGLNLEVYRGEIYSILGSNGSGKSTLLKILSGQLQCQRGALKVEDKGSIAMVPQNPKSIFTEITVGDELFEGTKGISAKDDEKIEKVFEMMRLMELSHLKNTSPYDLSGGEQQRLAIGKLLLTQSDTILLDEPTKALDSFFKVQLAEILKRLASMGKTIIMVSHDIEFCAGYSDRAAMFFHGDLIGENNSREFFKGNSFYTTAANKLLRKYDEDVVTTEEAKQWLKKYMRGV